MRSKSATERGSDTSRERQHSTEVEELMGKDEIDKQLDGLQNMASFVKTIAEEA